MPSPETLLVVEVIRMSGEVEKVGFSNEVAASAIEETADFNDFFRANYERVLRTMTLAATDKAGAEDLTQEAMARAFEQWDRVRKAEVPLRYVYAIAFNLLRRSKRREALLRRVLLISRASAHSSAEIDDALGARQILGQLPASEREALVLVAWCGLSYEESGRVLGIASASVRARVSRGRAHLRQLLEVSDV
jgi:RNA polymerase sigma-70 factor, ECF subfamily